MKLLLLLSLTLLTSCGNDSLKVVHNNDRVSELERRMALNEQVDAAQSALIDLNSQAIANNSAFIQDLSDRMDAYGQALDTEIAAREDGDQSLDDKISTVQALLFVQGGINVAVQFQIGTLNSKINQLTSKVNALKDRADSAESDINDLEQSMAEVEADISSLQSDVSNINSEVSALAVVADGLESRIEALELTDPVPGPQGIQGEDGPQGPAGPQGIPGDDGQSGAGASMSTISLSGSPSCKSTGVSGIYAKRDGSEVELYNNSSCSTSGSSNNKIAELDQTPQSGEHASFWISPTKLALTDGSSSANLVIINF